ncbi:unnamed protein product [Oikopleura dioica]|uniref:Uncharacterized protein n=1 Tax=Oikopleura dioica TaxID=34765 RepID=E4YBQ0_OIKDI|nr:unnamed protein product [Oikopleura dioica]
MDQSFIEKEIKQKMGTKAFSFANAAKDVCDFKFPKEAQKKPLSRKERFADSVAELNERIARERDEESEFLLQNQDYEDFQDYPIQKYPCLVFILFLLFFPIGWLAKKRQRLIEIETKKWPKTLENFKRAQILSQNLMEYCAGMIFATLCGHVTIWIIIAYYLKCMERPDCPWK